MLMGTLTPAGVKKDSIATEKKTPMAMKIHHTDSILFKKQIQINRNEYLRLIYFMVGPVLRGFTEPHQLVPVLREALRPSLRAGV
jgi:hypothetical protein